MKTPLFAGFPKEGLQFLRSLKRNNNREWFQKHKETYEHSVREPLGRLVEALAVDFASFAPELVASPKSSVYRIYRDTRFAKDKSPYKTHVAAIFPPKGFEKHQGAGLYLHISPAELFMGGGVYMPSAADLNLIRSHIVDNAAKFRATVESRPFQRMFGEVSGEQLVRVPRGFPADHPMAHYLRFKQFLAARTFGAEECLESRFYSKVVETFKAIMPLIRFLNEPLQKSQRARQRQNAILGVED